MLDAHRLWLFLIAAFILAVTPGPGIMYVLARTLAAGRREGLRSSLGTFLGGIVHVFAAAAGLSALVAASAIAFHTIKFAGAAYLVWLGVRMIRTRNTEFSDGGILPRSGALRQGVLTEILNPKTALFFLSFIPQFVTPAVGHIFLQFVLLGCLSVALNTCADIIVVLLSAHLERKVKSSGPLRRVQRVASGLGTIGLGAYLALSERHT